MKVVTQVAGFFDLTGVILEYDSSVIIWFFGTKNDTTENSSRSRNGVIMKVGDLVKGQSPKLDGPRKNCGL